jgi:hypothetical protein
MLHIGKLIIAAAVAAVALPAAAGNSWPQVPSVKPPPKSARLVVANNTAKNTQSTDGLARAGASPAKDTYAKPGTVDGFEYIGGDGGWQLAGHKYVLSNGRFVHSEECDHTIRAAQAVTPADIEKSQRLSPGA